MQTCVGSVNQNIDAIRTNHAVAENLADPDSLYVIVKNSSGGSIHAALCFSGRLFWVADDG